MQFHVDSGKVASLHWLIYGSVAHSQHARPTAFAVSFTTLYLVGVAIAAHAIMAESKPRNFG